jgi:hypothetical protein
VSSAPHCRQGPSGRLRPRRVDGASGLHESATPERTERSRHAQATERAGGTRAVCAPAADRGTTGPPPPRQPVRRTGQGRVMDPFVGNPAGGRDR